MPTSFVTASLDVILELGTKALYIVDDIGLRFLMDAEAGHNLRTTPQPRLSMAIITAHCVVHVPYACAPSYPHTDVNLRASLENRLETQVEKMLFALYYQYITICYARIHHNTLFYAFKQLFCWALLKIACV